MSTNNATVFNTVVSTVVGTASPGGGSLSGAKFTFNGVDQYAVMAEGWAAEGKPREYEFHFNTNKIIGTQDILSGTDGSVPFRFTLIGDLFGVFYKNAGGGGTSEYIPDFNIVVGEDYFVEVYNLGSVGGVNPSVGIRINGEEQDIQVFGPSAQIQPSLTNIGVDPTATTNFFDGEIWGLRLTDDSPIHDTTAVFGNSSRYGALNNPIDLSTGDIEITWEGVYGTGIDWVLSDGASSNPSGIRVSTSVQLFSGVATGIAHSHGMSVGQHYAGSVRFVGGDYFIDIDGVEIGTGTMSHLAWDAISELTGNSGISQFMDTTEAFQNIVITHSSGTYTYALDETSGSLIINSGTTAGDFDGVWTPDVAYTVVPPNSVYYPMNEGDPATVFECYRPDGSDYDDGDATITNPDAEGGGWPAEIPASPTNLIISGA